MAGKKILLFLFLLAFLLASCTNKLPGIEPNKTEAPAEKQTDWESGWEWEEEISPDQESTPGASKEEEQSLEDLTLEQLEEKLQKSEEEVDQESW